MKKVWCLFCMTLLCWILFCPSVFAAGDAQVLRVVAPWKAKGVNIDKSGFIFARMGCVEMLTTADRSGHISGLLTESWKVAEDGKTWTFILKSGITFHDQTPLTGEAAARSLKAALKKQKCIEQGRGRKHTCGRPAEPGNRHIRTVFRFAGLSWTLQQRHRIPGIL